MQNQSLNFAVLIAALVAASAVHARSTVPIIDHEKIAVVTGSGKSIDADSVKKAIAAGVASNGRKWELHPAADGKTLQAALSWNANKHTIVVEIVPTATQYSVKYVSSINMKYEVQSGTRVIHPHYNKFVEELIQSIRAELLKL